MGGQACIFYVAAEFSRDVDVAVSPSPENLQRLRAALDELKAGPVFFPPLSREALERGHACHFRCRAPGLRNMRLDVMAVMRNADPFEALWARRVRRRIAGAGVFPLVSVQDLVRIKKTQRTKDWPMVQRLVDADVLRTRRPSAERATFWLRECRSPGVLIHLAKRFPARARRLARERVALRQAARGDLAAVRREMVAEQDREQEMDRRYWAPLRRELEQWRLGRPRLGKKSPSTVRPSPR